MTDHGRTDSGDGGTGGGVGTVERQFCTDARTKCPYRPGSLQRAKMDGRTGRAKEKTHGTVDVRRTNGRGWTETPRRRMETDDADADGRTMNAKSRAVHYLAERREKNSFRALRCL